MTSDGRLSAWAGTWSHLKFAEKLRTDENGQIKDPLPEAYWAVLQEAHTMALLIATDLNVGLGVGAWLEEQADREEEQNRFRDEIINKVRNVHRVPKSDGCTCDWSRAACPVHLWPPKGDSEWPPKGDSE